MNITVASNMLDFVDSIKIIRTSWEKDSKFILLTQNDIQVCDCDNLSVLPYRLTIDDLRANDWITHKEVTDVSKP